MALADSAAAVRAEHALLHGAPVGYAAGFFPGVDVDLVA